MATARAIRNTGRFEIKGRSGSYQVIDPTGQMAPQWAASKQIAYDIIDARLRKIAKDAEKARRAEARANKAAAVAETPAPIPAPEPEPETPVDATDDSAPDDTTEAAPEMEPEAEQAAPATEITAPKMTPAEELAAVRMRLGIDTPLRASYELDIALSALEVPEADMIPTQQLNGMAHAFTLVSMMHQPSVAPIDGAPGRYRVITGRRRVATAQRESADTAAETIRCSVYEDLTRAQEALIILTENNTRTAAWVRDVMNIAELVHGNVQITPKELALILGIPVASVRELVRVARLPEAILSQIGAGGVKWATAKQMTRLNEHELNDLAERAACGETITPEMVSSKLTGQFDGLGAATAALLPTPAPEPAVVNIIEGEGEDEANAEVMAHARRDQQTRQLYDLLGVISADLTREARVRTLASMLAIELLDA